MILMKNYKYMITQIELKEILNYDPNTGLFTWKISPKSRNLFGKVAGANSINTKGYYTIMIKQKRYLTHRLAWLFMYGDWPILEIDHINRIKSDNRIENLRDVTRSINAINRDPWVKRSGYKCKPSIYKRKPSTSTKLNLRNRNGNSTGTYYIKRLKKWQSQIKINGKQKYLGLYNTQLEAHKRYLQELDLDHC